MPIPLIFDSVKLDCGYRAEIVVERKLIVEVKSVEGIHPLHLAQLLTHIRLANYKLGMLINFNVLKLKDGIKRRINGELD